MYDLIVFITPPTLHVKFLITSALPSGSIVRRIRDSSTESASLPITQDVTTKLSLPSRMIAGPEKRVRLNIISYIHRTNTDEGI